MSFGAERFDEGQALAHDPTRGLLHRLSNEWEGQVFEQIDLATLETRRTPLVDPLAEEAAFTALLFTGDGFLATDHGEVERGPSRFYALTEEGVVTQLGTLDHRSKGLAFVPEPSAALLLAGGLAALAVRRRRDAASSPESTARGRCCPAGAATSST